MKFLITGAYGFVGTNLCKYLTFFNMRIEINVNLFYKT